MGQKLFARANRLAALIKGNRQPLVLPAIIILSMSVFGFAAFVVAQSTSRGFGFEAESGTKGGGDVAYISDATASGGSALVFNAPSTGGNYGNDKWLFVGDSITVMTVNDSIATAVKAASPSRNPTIINEAIGGTTAETWADTNTAMGSISGVLASSDAKFVPLALGTNDYQPVFKANYEKLIQAVLAAGRVPVLPYMPWTNGESPGKEALINADIESLLTKYPQAMRGPNLYAATVNHPEYFQGVGNVHPNDTGQNVIRQAWVQTMLNSPPVSLSPLPSVPSNFDKSQWLVNDVVPQDMSWEPSGNFRTFCGHSHYNYDDPIVYPGQQGAAHLHNFYGNSSANYTSTYSLLRTNGTSSCQGGPLNRTGYWVPALHNAAGKLVVPTMIELYYKGNGSKAMIQAVQDNPNGLRMIAGFDMARTVPDYERGVWNCNNGGNTQTIPSCANGGEVEVEVRFPMCWNGSTIDSTNHRSHMAYGTGGGGWTTAQGGCPSSHPIHLPELTLFVRYESDGNSQNWYLSSDRMSGMAQQPNGSTFHADWFGGWDSDIQHTWTQECIREMRNCSWGQLGDGTRLKNGPETSYNGPWIIDPPVRP